MDLISLVLTLRPLAQPGLAETPPWWGRAAHSLLLKTIQEYDPQLSTALHALPGQETPAASAAQQDVLNPQAARPFTVSTLIGRFSKGLLIPAERYTLRLTGLHASVATHLLVSTQSGSLSPGHRIELDYIPFEIIAVAGGCQPGPENADATPWSGLTTYAELSAPFLLAKQEPPRQLRLLFTSPTTFKSGGKHVPVPLPELVFGSLLERWNAFAPIVFPAETRRYAAECLAISRYDLQTRPAPVKSGGIRVGATGEATYTTLNYDRYWMSVIAVLAAFSLYSGVGAGTTNGLGQARWVI